MSIVLGNGDATFQAPLYFVARSEPNSVTVGDFNADGKSDLAVANFWSHNLSIFRNTLNRVPTDLPLSNASVAENQPADTLVGTLLHVRSRCGRHVHLYPSRRRG